jgi:DNA repair exonuclease SbcCD ATPase subunit
MSQEFSPQPSKQDPIEQAQEQPEQQSALSASIGTPDPALQEAVQKMWEVVRKGADIIVTLRQENTILQSQISALRRSEQELQTRVEDFLTRISTLEEAATSAVPIHDGDPGASIDRLEDRVAELENLLVDANAKLALTTAQLEEQADISQQLYQLRSELEARTVMLAEFQDAFANRMAISPEETLPADSQAVDGLKKQLDLFATTSTDSASMSDEELAALANRLDSVAQELEDLFRLS